MASAKFESDHSRTIRTEAKSSKHNVFAFVLESRSKRNVWQMN